MIDYISKRQNFHIGMIRVWEYPDIMAEMERNARKEYELKYTAERNYDILMDIYQKAIEHTNGKRYDHPSNLSK